jgi:hypothetical protein
MMENDKEVQEAVGQEDSLLMQTTHHEEDHEVEVEDHHEVDYSGFTKSELVSAVKELAKEDNLKKLIWP